jgi:hypothetical protein
MQLLIYLSALGRLERLFLKRERASLRISSRVLLDQH